jgi:hypothetical protein
LLTTKTLCLPERTEMVESEELVTTKCIFIFFECPVEDDRELRTVGRHFFKIKVLVV